MEVSDQIRSPALDAVENRKSLPLTKIELDYLGNQPIALFMVS
jgi:hypothetical protein